MKVTGTSATAYSAALETAMPGSWTEDRRGYLRDAAEGVLKYVRSKPLAYGAVARLRSKERKNALAAHRRPMKKAAWGAIGAVGLFALVLRIFLGWMVNKMVERLIDYWTDEPAALMALCEQPDLDRQ